jgi:hypothetical protein
MWDVARQQNPFNTHIDPSYQKVREWYAPILFSFVNMWFENKMVASIALTQKTFVVLSFVFICYFLIQTEKRRQERVRGVRNTNIDQWQRDESNHFIEGHRSRGAIVKQDEVILLRIGFIRRNREGNIHNHHSK